MVQGLKYVKNFEQVIFELLQDMKKKHEKFNVEFNHGVDFENSLS